MANEKKDKLENACPWLVFQVNEVLYALNSAHIQSIMKMPEEACFVALPDAPDYIRNVVRIREHVVPTLDLRKLYGLLSVQDEYEAFRDTIDQRKQDHVHWVKTLKSCVDSGEKFTLATDPHKCKFGAWYYSHRTEHAAISFMMQKIEEPHRQLHEMAEEVLQCNQEHEKCKRIVCVKDAFEKMETELMPQILNSLDEIKEVFHNRYQEKLIVLEDGNRRIALIVDEVKAIDRLTKADGQEEFTEMMQNQYIDSVGRGEKSEELVLMLRSSVLLDLVKEGQLKALENQVGLGV